MDEYLFRHPREGGDPQPGQPYDLGHSVGWHPPYNCFASMIFGMHYDGHRRNEKIIHSQPRLHLPGDPQYNHYFFIILYFAMLSRFRVENPLKTDQKA